MRGSLKDTCVRYEYFCVALDERTDSKVSSLLAVFAREEMPSLDIVEEFVQFNSTKKYKYKRRYFQSLADSNGRHKIWVFETTGVTTDGSPGMVGQKRRRFSPGKTNIRPWNFLQN